MDERPHELIRTPTGVVTNRYMFTPNTVLRPATWAATCTFPLSYGGTSFGSGDTFLPVPQRPSRLDGET